MIAYNELDRLREPLPCGHPRACEMFTPDSSQTVIPGCVWCAELRRAVELATEMTIAVAGTRQKVPTTSAILARLEAGRRGEEK